MNHTIIINGSEILSDYWLRVTVLISVLDTRFGSEILPKLLTINHTIIINGSEILSDYRLRVTVPISVLGLRLDSEIPSDNRL